MKRIASSRTAAIAAPLADQRHAGQEQRNQPDVSQMLLGRAYETGPRRPAARAANDGTSPGATKLTRWNGVDGKAGEVFEIALAAGQSRQPRRRPELNRRQREDRGHAPGRPRRPCRMLNRQARSTTWRIARSSTSPPQRSMAAQTTIRTTPTLGHERELKVPGQDLEDKHQAQQKRCHPCGTACRREAATRPDPTPRASSIRSCSPMDGPGGSGRTRTSTRRTPPAPTPCDEMPIRRAAQNAPSPPQSVCSTRLTTYAVSVSSHR